jgi:hypothetical protein
MVSGEHLGREHKLDGVLVRNSMERFAVVLERRLRKGVRNKNLHAAPRRAPSVHPVLVWLGARQSNPR